MNCAVYILANARPTLYVGVTGNLMQRLHEHRTAARPGSFTARFRVHKLVHVEHFGDIRDAIAREKEIKSMRRERKLALIRRTNPTLRDLAPPLSSLLPPHRKAPAPWELRRARW